MSAETIKNGVKYDISCFKLNFKDFDKTILSNMTM